MYLTLEIEREDDGRFITDLPALRAACVDVFGARGTHAWPPSFAELAADLDLPERDLTAGTTAVRALIVAIDGAGHEG